MSSVLRNNLTLCVQHFNQRPLHLPLYIRQPYKRREAHSSLDMEGEQRLRNVCEVCIDPLLLNSCLYLVWDCSVNNITHSHLHCQLHISRYLSNPYSQTCTLYLLLGSRSRARSSYCHGQPSIVAGAIASCFSFRSAPFSLHLITLDTPALPNSSWIYIYIWYLSILGNAH